MEEPLISEIDNQYCDEDCAFLIKNNNGFFSKYICTHYNEAIMINEENKDEEFLVICNLCFEEY